MKLQILAVVVLCASALVAPAGSAETVTKSVSVTITDIPAEIASLVLSGDDCATTTDLAIDSSCANEALTATVIVFDRNGESGLIGQSVAFSLCAPDTEGAAQTTACTGAANTVQAASCTLGAYGAALDGLAACTATTTVNSGGTSPRGIHTVKAAITSTAASDTTATATFLVYHVMQIVIDAGSGAGVGNSLNFGSLADWVGAASDFTGASGDTRFVVANVGGSEFTLDFTMADLTNGASTISKDNLKLKRTATAGDYNAGTEACDAAFAGESPTAYTATAWDYSGAIAAAKCLLFDLSLSKDFATAANNVVPSGSYSGTMTINVVSSLSSYYKDAGTYQPGASATSFQQLTDSIGSFTLA